jgi:4-methyl-5(b-hydroxyethyl)-thiazole monophosphate biosynthesis
MKKVLLLLAKGFETYEASVFIDILGWNLTYGDGSTEMYSCGLAKKVISSFNFSVYTDFIIDEIDPGEYDALAVPGGFEKYGYYDDAFDEKFLGLIREFHGKGKIVASICTGALPVGKSGILLGKKGTTYNLKDGLRLRQLGEFGVNVIDEPVVIDGNIITCRNPAAAVEAGFKLLELLSSEDNAKNISRIMGF